MLDVESEFVEVACNTIASIVDGVKNVEHQVIDALDSIALVQGPSVEIDFEACIADFGSQHKQCFACC